MMTLSSMIIKTNWMMEQIRINALNDTLTKWKEALKNYYSVGYDNGETTKFYNELIALGADPDELFDIDFNIREKYCEV